MNSFGGEKKKGGCRPPAPPEIASPEKKKKATPRRTMSPEAFAQEGKKKKKNVGYCSRSVRRKGGLDRSFSSWSLEGGKGKKEKKKKGKKLLKCATFFRATGQVWRGRVVLILCAND